MGHLKLMTDGQSLSMENSTGYSTTHGNEPSCEPVEARFQQLKYKLLKGYSFQAIEDNFVIVYGIKSLVKKLNLPIAPHVVVGFILEFEPLLDQITQDLQKKKRSQSQDDVSNQCQFQRVGFGCRIPKPSKGARSRDQQKCLLWARIK